MFYSIISGANEGGNFLKTKRRGGDEKEHFIKLLISYI